MKQVVILSGKGGTGKTSVCASFAWLFSKSHPENRPVLVDADVDAANLSLILQPFSSMQHEFWGGGLAEINEEKCVGCGLCESVCRYDAILIHKNHQDKRVIDPIACDGCAACTYICPQRAIEMIKQKEGFWYQSETSVGPLFHAELFPGRDNSGKLVTMVKQQARLYAEDNQSSLMIIDGPPGIGCPVISACAGADLGLVVAEPSQAGIHDLKRILSTLTHFQIPAKICINKADIYPAGTEEIRKYAHANGYEVIGEIPYDESIPKAMLEGKPVNEFLPEAEASLALEKIWIILELFL
ncbi:MAG: 4Fe-4S binding protein [Leptolinea sp.]|jgi:MinD superfamily P-loop ATPase|nr:4Fe-4S binding protein [Leptolinea sp.]